MGLAIEIADAVTAEINTSGLLPSGVTAVRQVLPEFELKDLVDLKVTVVPHSVNITGASRTSSQYEIAIDVGLQKKVASENMNTEVATLGTLVDEITSHLQRRPLAGFPWAAWVSIANDPIYVPEHLAQQSVFTSVLTITYRAIK